MITNQAYSGYMLERLTNMGEQYYISRYLEEARKHNIDLQIIGARDICLADKCLLLHGKPLEHRDFILTKYKTGHIVKAAAKLAGHSYNKTTHVEHYNDKYHQYQDLLPSGINQPLSNLGYLDTDYELLSEQLGSVFVVKSPCSSQGKDVHLIHNKKEYQALKTHYKPSEEMLFQEFVASSFGKDLRLFVIQGEVIACMKRKAKDSFQANFSRGGSVEPYPVSEELERIAQTIYKLTGIFYMGIDLLFGKDSYIFCELNVTPGIKGIETATEINVAGTLLHRIKQDLQTKK